MIPASAGGLANIVDMVEFYIVVDVMSCGRQEAING